MMKKLLEEVEELKEKEYSRAAAKFGLKNNSDHESYAVLLEETEEASDELAMVQKQMAIFWSKIRSDESPSDKLTIARAIEFSATQLAAEAIQVAAMAKKAAVTIRDPEADKELAGGRWE